MAVVLFGAALHAGWNALVRASANKFHDTTLIVAGAGMWAALLLPLAPIPAIESWPYLAVSVIIHVVYFSLVAFAYRDGELSFAYPIMRGTAPALTAIVVALLLHETPSWGASAGITLISCGVLILGVESWRTGRLHVSSTLFALTNSCVIVAYTVIDGQGARLSANAFSYTGWMFFGTALLLTGISYVIHGRDLTETVRLGWRRGLIGGACTLASYALALWAMTRAPIALVAALRETSVVFGAIIAATYLKERVSRLGYTSVLNVTAGAIAIKVY